MRETMGKDRLVRYLFRNVGLRKDNLIKFIGELDTDGDGRISLAEAAVALKSLWRAAMGKVPKKQKKMRTLD